MKIEDGDDKRARAVISVEVLRQLGIFEKETLSEISPLPILNRRVERVGRVEATIKMRTIYVFYFSMYIDFPVKKFPTSRF